MGESLLQHGQFFGTQDLTRDAAGFALAIKCADPARPVARHTHADAHFILLLDGHYVSTAQGAGHLHAEPALIYNPPGTTHADSFPERSGRFLGVSVSHARFAEAAALARPIEHAVRMWTPSAVELAHRIERALVGGAGALALEAACLELVSTFVADLEHASPVPPRWLRVAREVLADRAREDVTMTAVADAAAVHPVHLARAFRRYYGIGPAEFVRRRRVELAAAALRTTRASLAQIALDCGYVDQSHFTRAFGRTVGVSPAAYRRRHVARVQARPARACDS